MKLFSTKTSTPEFKEIVAFLVLFYFLPILLLAYRVIPQEANHVILVLMSLITVAYASSKPISARQLGFRRDNLGSSLTWTILASSLFLVALYFIYKTRAIEPKYAETALFYVFYIFISAPLQEFVFRSLMFHELNLYFKKDWFKVVLSAVIFSFAHYTYRDPSVLFLTLVAGLVWGFIYLKRPNFWALAISHAVVGAATVFLGFV